MLSFLFLSPARHIPDSYLFIKATDNPISFKSRRLDCFKPYQIEIEGSAGYVLVHTVDDFNSLSQFFFFLQRIQMHIQQVLETGCVVCDAFEFVAVFTLWFTHLVFFFVLRLVAIATKIYL